MSKLYTARVLADSEILTPHDERYDPPRRAVTIEYTTPRFILAEVNTHRKASRNSASSRAIPTADRYENGKLITKGLITRVREDPFVPLKFNKRVKGMGVGVELANSEAEAARKAWLWARDQAIKAAEIMVELDVDKSRANRLLEPFMEHTIIMTMDTRGLDNFFALRHHPLAQPEFQLVAKVMLKTMLESTPKYLAPGQWAMPLVTDRDLEDTQMDFGPTAFLDELGEGARFDYYWPMISASRCARVSYDTHENWEPVAKSMERAETLVKNGHLSPLEHVLRAPTEQEFYDQTLEGQHRRRFLEGNIDGFVQLRKMIPYDWNRVGHIEGRMSWEEMDVPEIPELIAA